VAQQEIVAKLRELIRTLPNIEERLIRRIYFEGATLQEAADALGISKSWASRLHAKALEQLARSLRRLGASE
jgi:RNA polymerase sigma factor for flagellar operon FliA